MGLISLLSSLGFSQDHKISEKLEKIGYFDLIDDNLKKIKLKEKIDFDYNDNSNQYIGKGWLTFPNDYYISDVYNLKEYKNGSSTSEFRAFEVWSSSLFRGQFVEYLESAKIVFEKNGLRLDWKDETFDENSTEKIYHRITVNETEYIIFSEQVNRENIGQAMYEYLNSFKNILNKSIQQQNKDYKVILVTLPEYVVFVLLNNNMLVDFKKIISKTKNKIEE
ncbi:hypothetical protein [Paenimyroides aestuarii]|uniref:Uncharacterized protein n=1 Tax=Paenimyroides aestuarii TaxID=2968490 RepID=A0ABY5NQP3_9FLAO|nr:hypothetical protein [Paenimyroides aestuarii]UUV20757.1 hypothetical protein NPX36_10565 [Paenimyroides aestuarii]